MSRFIHWPSTAESRDRAFELCIAYAHHKHTVCQHRNKMSMPQCDRHLHTEPHSCERTPWTQRDGFLPLATSTCVHPPVPSACPAYVPSLLGLSWALGVSHCSPRCPPLPAACCLCHTHADADTLQATGHCKVLWSFPS